MKKFISVILMAALALSLFAACGKTDDAPKALTCPASLPRLWSIRSMSPRCPSSL